MAINSIDTISIDTISIDEFLLNIPENEILIIDNENPIIDNIITAFIENPKLNAIKYTVKTKNIFIDKITKMYYYKFPRYYVDIITNIRSIDNTILLLNNRPIKCNINNLTLPIINMQYTTSKLEITSNNVILYDVYILSNNLRDKIRKKTIINNENMIFVNKGTYYY